MARCEICLQYEVVGTTAGDLHFHKCPRCGNYRVTGSVIAQLEFRDINPRQRANPSGWFFENPDYTISTTNLNSLLNIRTPNFHSRADKLLQNFERETEFIGQYAKKKPSWLACSWSLNMEELDEILGFLDLSRRIHLRVDGPLNTYSKILSGGWERLEKLRETNPQSTQCFVAMWFNDEMKQIYDEAFAKAILAAGYKPHRVDQREYNDKIDDEIIVQIRRSRFIVADFTGHRGGVYYEAGFAKGLGLEVIWTCRKDEIDKLHFDIRQYNCIDWEKDHLAELSQRLTKRIESVFGHGPM